MGPVGVKIHLTGVLCVFSCCTRMCCAPIQIFQLNICLQLSPLSCSELCCRNNNKQGMLEEPQSSLVVLHLILSQEYTYI